MARIVAQGFLDVARKYFGALPEELQPSARKAAIRKGDLAAAATCLALAIELQLKALAVEAGKKPLRKHDLGLLFLELPKTIREAIERAYADFAKKAPPKDLGALELWITTTPTPPTPEEAAKAPPALSSNHTVLELLRSEQNAFQNWRYVYEPDMPSGFRLYAFTMVDLLSLPGYWKRA